MIRPGHQEKCRRFRARAQVVFDKIHAVKACSLPRPEPKRAGARKLRHCVLAGARLIGCFLLANIAATSAQSVATVTTIAGGNGSTGGCCGPKGSTDGIGTAALFEQPLDMAVTPDGSTMYVVDYANHRIRRIDLSNQNVVTTFVGNGSIGYADGVGTDAMFDHPMSVVVSSDAAILYLSDTNSHRIRQVDIASRVVTTLVGSGERQSTDGVGTAARITYPYGLAIDSTSSFLFVAEPWSNKIRQIEMASRTVTTLGLASFGTGYSGTAPHDWPHPQGIAISPDDATLYMGEYAGCTIAELNIASARSATSPPNSIRIAGAHRAHAYANGYGLSARFYNPKGVAVSADGYEKGRTHEPKESSSAMDSLTSCAHPFGAVVCEWFAGHVFSSRTRAAIESGR